MRFTGLSSYFTSLPPRPSLLLLSSSPHPSSPRCSPATMTSHSCHVLFTTQSWGMVVLIAKGFTEVPICKTKQKKNTLCGLITVYNVVFSTLMRTMWVWKLNNSNLSQSCYLGVGSGLKLEIVLDHVIDNFCFRLSFCRVISIDIVVCFCLYNNHTNIKWFDRESRCSAAKVIVSLGVQALFNKSVFSLMHVDRKREGVWVSVHVCHFAQSV